MCDLLVSLISPDLDLDGNGVLDHASAGLWIEGVPVTVRGRYGCN